MRTDSNGRRTILSGVAATAAAVALMPGRAGAQTSRRAYQPARHSQDAWLDAVPGSHRTVVDCASVASAGAGVLYANNMYLANASGYALKDADVAVVVCLRHFATVFAYNDVVWAKYGQALSDAVSFTDPKSHQAPSANLLNSADYGLSLPNLGVTIPAVVKRGVQFAVCDMATHAIAGQVATAVKADAGAVYTEFVRNLIPNSHLMAAGVIAVNRAQEYGYTLLTSV